MRKTEHNLIQDLLENCDAKIRQKVLICFIASKLGWTALSEMQNSVRIQLHLSP